VHASALPARESLSPALSCLPSTSLPVDSSLLRQHRPFPSDLCDCRLSACRQAFDFELSTSHSELNTLNRRRTAPSSSLPLQMSSRIQSPPGSAASGASSSGNATRRLYRELEKWRAEQEEEKGIERLAPVSDGDLFEWEAVINGRDVGYGYDGTPSPLPSPSPSLSCGS
jgi:hypothetical protein